jgi:hypothetical protein
MVFIGEDGFGKNRAAKNNLPCNERASGSGSDRQVRHTALLEEPFHAVFELLDAAGQRIDERTLGVG